VGLQGQAPDQIPEVDSVFSGFTRGETLQKRGKRLQRGFSRMIREETRTMKPHSIRSSVWKEETGRGTGSYKSACPGGDTKWPGSLRARGVGKEGEFLRTSVQSKGRGQGTRLVLSGGRRRKKRRIKGART